jgi:thioester reductase-like protein
MTKRRILLTGATGTLGMEILPRLLELRSTAEVILLIRGADDEAVQERLEGIRRYVHLWWPHADFSKVRAVRGDVSKPGLGLCPEDHRAVQLRTTHFIHSAASTSLNLSRRRALQVNVRGSDNALHFATLMPNLAHYMHISTAFVCGNRAGRIAEDELWQGQGFVNNYELSKVISERRVQRHADRLPITICRPSIVLGDARDGHVSALLGAYYPLGLIADGALDGLPAADAFRLDIVTVDYVAENIVALLGAPVRSGEVYHLTAGPGASTPIGKLVAAAKRHGNPTRGPDRTPAGGSQDAEVLTADLPRALKRRLDVFFPYLRNQKDYDDSALRARLGARYRPHAQPAEFLPALMRYCHRTRWGTEMPWNADLLVGAAG